MSEHERVRWQRGSGHVIDLNVKTAGGAGLTAMQVFLLELDPIVGCGTESGSPCGDPVGYETWAKPIRLSEVLTAHPYARSSALEAELDRLGWNLQ